MIQSTNQMYNPIQYKQALQPWRPNLLCTSALDRKLIIAVIHALDHVGSSDHPIDAENQLVETAKEYPER